MIFATYHILHNFTKFELHLINLLWKSECTCMYFSMSQWYFLDCILLLNGLQFVFFQLFAERLCVSQLCSTLSDQWTACTLKTDYQRPTSPDNYWYYSVNLKPQVAGDFSLQSCAKNGNNVLLLSLKLMFNVWKCHLLNA